MRIACKKSEQGFTLMEAIVATFIFALVVSSILGIYNYTLKINRRANAIRTASEDVRFLSEFLSKEIRNGKLNYGPTYTSPCGPLSASGNSLSITNVDGDSECFYLGDANGSMNNIGPFLWLIKDSYSKQALNVPGVKINSLIFNVSPTCNPYYSGSCSKTQPVVTMIGSLQVNPDSQDNIIVPLETSVSILQYGP